MVEVRFYGKLRCYGEDSRPDGLSRRVFSPGQVPTLEALLQEVGIGVEELGHVFLNGRLLQTRATMARWLGYPDAAGRVPQGGTPLDVPLRVGDRVALFGLDMALLVI